MNFEEGEGFSVWAGVFDVTRVNNTGAAFGLWKNGSLFLMWVSTLSIIFILVYLWRLRTVNRTCYGWALIAGGALGNLYDRVHFGYVIDFIDLGMWPVFNIADSFICIGVFWILLQVFWKSKLSAEKP
jgi:signal peptidase II